jgi:hypothetical protein
MMTNGGSMDASEKTRAERKEAHAREVMQTLAQNLLVAGHKVQMSTTGVHPNIIGLDGIKYGHALVVAGFDREGFYRGGGLPTLRVKVRTTTGRYSEATKLFPEPKAGFDYQKLAAAVLEAHKGWQAKYAQIANEEATQGAAADRLKALGWKDVLGPQQLRAHAGPSGVRVTMELNNATDEQIQKVMAFFKELTGA